MGSFRLLAGVLLAASLAVPAAAGAAPPAARHHRTPLTTSLAASTTASALSVAADDARRYWGAVPCQGTIGMTVRRTLPAGLEADSDAWVTFDSSLGANNLAAPASSYSNCVIAFGIRRWPTAASMVSDWDMLCMTMIHEMGHLLGHPHDPAYGNIMVPVFTDYSSEPPICRTNRVAGADR